MIGNRSGPRAIAHGLEVVGPHGEAPAAHGVAVAGMSNHIPDHGGQPPTNMLQKESGRVRIMIRHRLDGQIPHVSMLGNPNKRMRLKKNGKNTTYPTRTKTVRYKSDLNLQNTPVTQVKIA